MEQKSSAMWNKVIEEHILSIFKNASNKVPAYKTFLQQHSVDVTTIQEVGDIERIPSITKQNYLRTYPWQELCVDGSFAGKSLVLTATSGSTGEPFYIPHADAVRQAHKYFMRQFIEHSGLDSRKSTLVIGCFGMGVWIGGLLTYEAFRRISEDGWPLTVITPGVNKKEIFDALKHVGASYEQLILCGYPPFIKDIIDEGSSHDIEWKRWDMRVVCAAEAFSEKFRDYLIQKTGIKNTYRSVINIYGSAELGTMATETPLTILLRRLAIKNTVLYEKLFKIAHRLPTLVQFVPNIIAFEQDHKGALYATGGTALPFIRYNIGDNGGVFSYDDAVRLCREVGIDLVAEAEQAGIVNTIDELPFVYLYERADLSTKLYGAIVYPEHVKNGLQQPEFDEHTTGRFTMETEHDENHDEFLKIHVELKHGVEEGNVIEKKLVWSIVQSLVEASSEYQYLHSTVCDKVVPRIEFWKHEHPKYFSPTIKQKWVVRRV